MSLNKVLVAIGIFVLLVGAVFFFTYNGLVSAEEGVDAQWYQVENQYQRRADLIPNLVDTVKGYAAHEEQVFTEVTRYRSQWSAAATQEEKMAAAEGMDSAISRLLVVVESYPQLKANENFLALQAQLEGTENRIAVERMRYNEKVRDYNTQLKRIPSSFVAGMLGSEPKAYFEAEKGAQNVPKVNFNQPGATSTPSTTTSPTIANASVKLYGVKTDVEVGENIVLKLSAVNLITKPVMTAQIILSPPSGMSVTSSDFVVSGAGQYSTTYKLEPGSAKDIEIMIQTVQTGDFIVEGRVIYYFGTDLSTQEDHRLNLPVKVRSKKPIT
ncbi:MAG: LemA family protein [Euryarchaeota archaeon]|nr:LemA family protein [Euryarchaeota archaeon]MBU4340764.1 LemA family protein [Euryarchaeota archaeon]MBU4454693.1 LemA family protein [Euryarchaeota archaeon]MCG2736775.1 LemA family protein [Candidatus Methanoperedenaceae archaeon]